MAFLLICVPTYPFYIIAHEEYYTHEMNLPIINAAAEGTVFVGSLFAINAIFGTFKNIFLRLWVLDPEDTAVL